MIYQNLTELHRLQAERLGPRPALRFKRFGLYHDLTWEQYRAASLACAAALVEAGVRPGDRVGLLSENRVEWMVADLGILAAGGVTVSPHAALSARQVHFEMHHAGARWLFASTAAQCDKVRQVRDELPGLAGVVAFDAAAAGVPGEAGSPGVESWDDFLRRGRQALARHGDELARREAALGPADLATI